MAKPDSRLVWRARPRLADRSSVLTLFAQFLTFVVLDVRCLISSAWLTHVLMFFCLVEPSGSLSIPRTPSSPSKAGPSHSNSAKPDGLRPDLGPPEVSTAVAALDRAFEANGEKWVGRLASSFPEFRCDLKLAAWSDFLRDHPDRRIVDTIVDGIRTGVRVGFEGSRPSVACTNRKSVASHAADITNNIRKELEAGRIAGPFSVPPFQSFCTSPLGAVPKKGSADKIRRIHDLSHPHGFSVNSGIEDGTVKYARFDDAVSMVRKLGRGCWLWKTDLANAFRHVPIHRDDVPLLGFVFAGLFFFDLFLPFGLRSSPRLFEVFATALQWILQHHFGFRWVVHYLDDFLGAARADSKALAVAQFQAFLRVCESLGLSVNVDKIFDPRQVMIFLGIEIDTIKMVIQLPADKMVKLKSLLEEFASAKQCSVKRLQSLVGHLSYACKVVRPGRAFRRRILDTLRMAKRYAWKTIFIGSEFRADLNWWRLFVDRWNGQHAIVNSDPAESLHVSTDASNVGFGAFHQNRWVAGTWSEVDRAKSIDWRELQAVLLAASAWAHLWRGRHVTFHIDNLVVVSVVSNMFSGSAELSALVRSLHFLAASFQFEFSAVHVPGVHNVLADLLSRDQLTEFRRRCPLAAPSQDQPSQQIILSC